MTGFSEKAAGTYALLHTGVFALVVIMQFVAGLGFLAVLVLAAAGIII